MNDEICVDYVCFTSVLVRSAGSSRRPARVATSPRTTPPSVAPSWSVGVGDWGAKEHKTPIQRYIIINSFLLLHSPLSTPLLPLILLHRNTWAVAVVGDFRGDRKRSKRLNTSYIYSHTHTYSTLTLSHPSIHSSQLITHPDHLGDWVQE